MGDGAVLIALTSTVAISCLSGLLLCNIYHIFYQIKKLRIPFSLSIYTRTLFAFSFIDQIGLTLAFIGHDLLKILPICHILIPFHVSLVIFNRTLYYHFLDVRARFIISLFTEKVSYLINFILTIVLPLSSIFCLFLISSAMPIMSFIFPNSATFQNVVHGEYISGYCYASSKSWFAIFGIIYEFIFFTLTTIAFTYPIFVIIYYRDHGVEMNSRLNNLVKRSFIIPFFLFFADASMVAFQILFEGESMGTCMGSIANLINCIGVIFMFKTKRSREMTEKTQASWKKVRMSVLKKEPTFLSRVKNKMSRKIRSIAILPTDIKEMDDIKCANRISRVKISTIQED